MGDTAKRIDSRVRALNFIRITGNSPVNPCDAPRHTSYVTRRTSHVTVHTSHTRHMSRPFRTRRMVLHAFVAFSRIEPIAGNGPALTSTTMRMMRKAILSTDAMSLSVMALIGFGPVAHADSGGCPKNGFFLFEHDNYPGGRAVFHKTTRRLAGVWQASGISRVQQWRHGGRQRQLRQRLPTGAIERVSKVDLGRGPDAEAAKRPGPSRRRTAAGPGRQQFPTEPLP